MFIKAIGIVSVGVDDARSSGIIAGGAVSRSEGTCKQLKASRVKSDIQDTQTMKTYLAVHYPETAEP